MSTAIATIEKFDLPTEVGAAAFDAEEFEGITLDFPRVKIPAGGGTAFELPNPDDPDDPNVEKTLEGVIVYQHPAGAYWEDPDGDNSAPDCASDDGVMGYGNPGGACASCPLNEFGSGEGGKGKACKNMRQIYLLREGDLVPLMLSLPPTSLKSFKQYANALMLGGRLLSGVKTQVSLKKQETGSNTYSVATFRMVGALTPDLARETKDCATRFRELIKGLNMQKRTGAAPVAYSATEDVAVDEDY